MVYTIQTTISPIILVKLVVPQDTGLTEPFYILGSQYMYYKTSSICQKNFRTHIKIKISISFY